VRNDGDTDPLEQYVWDGRYVHSPCLRWRDANTDGDLDEEGDSVLYYTNDANFNVTALVAADGVAGHREALPPHHGVSASLDPEGVPGRCRVRQTGCRIAKGRLT